MPRKTHDDSLETRKRILESALRLFSRRGFERTSLSDIAKYSNVTRGAIYWHFENKEDLFAALCEELDKDQFSASYLYEASLGHEEDPLGKLRGWLMMMIDPQSTNYINSSIFSMVISIINGGSTNELLKAKVMKFAQSRRDFISAVIRNAIEREQLPKNLNVGLAVEHLGMFIVGFMYQSRINMTDDVLKNFDLVVGKEIDVLKTLVNQE